MHPAMISGSDALGSPLDQYYYDQPEESPDPSSWLGPLFAPQGTAATFHPKLPIAADLTAAVDRGTAPKLPQPEKLQLPSISAVASASLLPPPKPFLFTPQGTLNLEVFKAFPCKNESNVHDRKGCPFYHNQRDRRRFPVIYRAEQCEDHFDLDTDFNCACPDGERCGKCHNRHELLYHPEIYKQRFCSSYPNVECHRGKLCAFAHTRAEIRCKLFAEEHEHLPTSEFFMLEFKTLWCPYGVQHDWHGCLYAHTYQDCRRSPQIGYGSEPCPYWQKDLHSADYKKRCPLGARCPYSHGSKEQLYHPAYYKSMPCADYKTRKSCPRGELCAFYHDQLERRPVPSPSDGFEPATAVSGGGAVTAASLVRAYDYAVPIPEGSMGQLQGLFMRPPLFNLDDFEAFGHASRCGTSGRRSSAASNSMRFSFPALTPSSSYRPLTPTTTTPSPTTPAACLASPSSVIGPKAVDNDFTEFEESIPSGECSFSSMTIMTGPEPTSSLERLLQLIGNHRPVIFITSTPPPSTRPFANGAAFWVDRRCHCAPCDVHFVLSQIVSNAPATDNSLAVAFDHHNNSDIASSERIVTRVLDAHPTFEHHCEVFHHVRNWSETTARTL